MQYYKINANSRITRLERTLYVIAVRDLALGSYSGLEALGAEGERNGREYILTPGSEIIVYTEDEGPSYDIGELDEGETLLFNGPAFAIGELDAADTILFRAPDTSLFPTLELKASYLAGYKAATKARIKLLVLEY